VFWMDSGGDSRKNPTVSSSGTKPIAAVKKTARRKKIYLKWAAFLAINASHFSGTSAS
jgi:hypothetical protein